VQNDKDDQPRTDPNKQSRAPWFSGPLTKERLLACPDQSFIISNVAHSPFNPALELQLTEEISRESLWRLIVDCRLDGRTFAVFLDNETFQAEKDARLKMAWGLISNMTCSVRSKSRSHFEAPSHRKRTDTQP
jgi:hypothetical protein